MHHMIRGSIEIHQTVCLAGAPPRKPLEEVDPPVPLPALAAVAFKQATRRA
jgi:hypothetical protein